MTNPLADSPNRLSKGANVALRDLDATLGAVTVVLDTQAAGGRAVDGDVSLLLLGADRRVRSGGDLIFYNQPTGLEGAIQLRDKLRPEPAAEGGGLSVSDVVTLELDDIADEIECIIIAASLDPATGMTFGDAARIAMRLVRTSDDTDLLLFEISDATDETALLFGEFYRRDGAWKLRAVG